MLSAVKERAPVTSISEKFSTFLGCGCGSVPSEDAQKRYPSQGSDENHAEYIFLEHSFWGAIFFFGRKSI